ncbi:hypothetical protein ES703_89894 [subsurface metagenome]
MEEENEETFLAKIGHGWRITIPLPVRQWLGLKRDGIVRIRIVEQKAEE